MKKFMTSWLLLLFVVFLVACGGGDEKEEYTITFNVNGGPAVTAITVEEGTLATAPTAPTRTGYVFKGWFADEALTTQFSFALPITGDLTLYAKWAQLFTVTFDTDEGTAVAPVQVEQGLTVLQPSDPTKAGFVFEDWYTTEALTTKYNFGAPVTANITLFAGYTAIAEDQFVVSFNSNGGSYIAPQVVTDGDAVAAPTAPTRAGFTFQGWNLGATAYNFATPVTANITLTAQWQAIPQYTVTFQRQDGIVLNTETVYQGTAVAEPVDPVRDGYEFQGWFVQGEEALEVYDFSSLVTANLTIIAVFKLIPPAVDTNATYLTYIGTVTNLNPYSETLANASELYTLVSDYLYDGDYDWDLAIDLGIASEVGDFTNTAQLPFNYFPAMATERPVDVNGDGMVWEVTLREDLEFVDGTPIDANTFDYSYKQLLDPKLLNARATNLYSTDSLPLINAEAYFKQLTPDKDALGFIMYTVGEVQYSRENAYFGLTDGGYDIYHVENKYQNLIGPEGIKAYVENWGDAAYGLNGWVLETQADTYFKVGTDNNLYAPTTGWTLDGVPVPAVTELPDGVTIKTGAAQYAGAYPAYMDAEGNRATTDEDGIPVGGVETYEQATPVLWSEVGFEVVDQYTMRFHLAAKKSQWQVMTNLSSAITSVVHPANFESGKIEGGARTNYGSIDNPLVAFGRYEIIEWQPDGFFRFQRNEDHYDAADYRIKYIRYDIINDQSTAVNEFQQGRLDLAGASGSYYQTYKNSPYLKLSPVTTFFRFAFSLDRMKDGNSENDTPIMQYLDFRKALYFATDRETFVTDVRAPGFPTHGILGPVYFSSEQNPFSYRASVPGQEVLADLAPETNGYDPIMAKQLFDQVYAQAVADEVITDGDVVAIEFVFADAESNHTMANWLEATWEEIFGDKFDLVKNAVPSATLTATGTGIWDTGNFDLTFGGWQGLQFWAPGMLQVYSSGRGAAYILEVGFETGGAILEVELGAGKAAVQGWLDELLLVEEPTSSQEEYIDLFEDFLADFTGDIYTNTYDYIWETVYYTILDYDLYEGREDDFDRITAALEGELLGQMINIPLFTTVGATVYSARVQFEAQAYHARMGWGGLKYMYIGIMA
jgi:oligopeptide transport system substrate-binding protein